MPRFLDEIDLVFERIAKIEEDQRKKDEQRTRNTAVFAIYCVIALAILAGRKE